MSAPRSIPGVPRLTLAVALAVSLLVIEARLVLGGKTWDDIPYHTEVAPPRIAASHAVLAGELPGWWEGSGLGVPLIGEPSHGAAYPAIWLATSSRALDWILLAHLFWLALGVAALARRVGAGDLASAAAGLVAAASGIAASAATRGALPAIAHLPWIAWAALGLSRGREMVSDTISRADGREMVSDTISRADGREMVSDTISRGEVVSISRDGERDGEVVSIIALGLLLGAVGLAGELGALIDGLAIAIVLGARRGQLRVLALAIGAGLAISMVQWLPALLAIGSSAGGELHALKLSRLLELFVPGCFGGTTGDRAVTAIAGEHAWWPSLYAGAAMFALAIVARAPGRPAVLAIAFAVLAFVVGRGGGWPLWIGAPEVHLAALVVLVCAIAARGLDELLDGDDDEVRSASRRRAVLALVGAALASAIALGAVAMLRSRASSTTDASALDQTLVHGAIGIGCLAAAISLALKRQAFAAKLGGPTSVAIAVAALVVAPTVGALGITAPVTARASVDTAPLWAEAAQKANAAAAAVPGGAHAGPGRVFRPLSLFESRATSSLPEAIATLTGESPALFGLAAARSSDPARPAMHDRAWLAAASGGGALLARFGIALAVLPATMLDVKGVTSLAQRGSWALVRYPATPSAAVVPEWIWIADDATALARLFPAGGNGLPTGLVVVRGHGTDRQDEPGEAEPCNIARWTPGAIDLTCVAQADAMAVVSSSPADGWTVDVAGKDTPWLVADVLRRAVPLPAGASVVSWRFVPPGLFAGVVAAGGGIAVLVIFGVLATRRRRHDRASRATN